MFAARRLQLARAAAGPAQLRSCCFSFDGLLGPFFGSASTHDGRAIACTTPQLLQVGSDTGTRPQLPDEDFASYLRNVKKENEASAAARRASLESALDADLLSLLRSNVVISKLKAKLLADAAAMKPRAEAVIYVPLKAILGSKHAELYKLAMSPISPFTSTTLQRLRDLLDDRPGPLKLFEAEVGKQLTGTGEAVNVRVSQLLKCVTVTVSIDLNK